MATSSPTPNHDWLLPIPGGSVNAWGEMLNKIFAEDGEPLGVDGVLGGIQSEIADAATDVATLTGRVETLEAAGGSAGVFAARAYLSGTQVAPKGNTVQLAFNAENFDHGDIRSGGTITIPAGGAGLYEIRAQILVPFWVGTGDDAYTWLLQIRRGAFLDGDVLASANTPYLNDGVSSGSGSITLAASCNVKLAEGDTLSVWARQSFLGSGNFSADIQGGTANTFFEVARLTVD